MKKNIIIFSVIFLVALLALAWVYFLKDGKDAGDVPAQQKQEEVGNAPERKDADQGDIPQDAVMVVIRTPKASQVVESPLKIEGEARGTWYFEASFPVKLVNKEGVVLAQGIATALSDWMTTSFVPFELTLEFDPGSASEGMLIFEKDNPSGLPENADSYELPVFFTNGTHTTVKAYFGNTLLDKDPNDCSDVYPVEREVEKIPKIGQAALEELLRGPTEEEKERGYFTSLEEGTEIRGLSIQHGVAFVDFNETLDANVAGSCRVTAIRSQIEQTLKQFPTVNEVQIYIGERSEDVLQP